MEITVGLFIVLLVAAFICEYIDSSLGMGYGTILAPVLIIMGIDPLLAIPSLLLSQAVGGFTASIFHHQFENVSFKPGSKDLKIVITISSFGIVAVVFSALIAISVPIIIIKTYIGLLVIVMGIIILKNFKFVFSWKKIIFISLLSSFNKGFSGGGFGPVVTGGQIIAGQNHKNAIGVTTLAEAPICTVGFLTYIISRTMTEIKGPILTQPFSSFIQVMFSKNIFQWELVLALLLGSVLVVPFGAFTTKKIDSKNMHLILGAIIIILGIWTLIKTYL